MYEVEYAFRSAAAPILEELEDIESSMGIRSSIEFAAGGRPFPHLVEETSTQYRKGENDYFFNMVRSNYFTKLSADATRVTLISLHRKLPTIWDECWNNELQRRRSMLMEAEIGVASRPSVCALVTACIALFLGHVFSSECAFLNFLLVGAAASCAVYLMLLCVWTVHRNNARARLNKMELYDPSSGRPPQLFSDKEAITGRRDIDFEQSVR